MRTDGARVVGREAWRLGPLGFRDRVEPVLRAIVAERMGVSSEELLPDVSFVQDLGAMASDVTELVVAAEQAIGAHVDEAAIDRVHTYGDLVDAVVAARTRNGDASPLRMLLRTVLVPGRRDRRGIVVRAVWSTPYAVAAIADEARRAGTGGCLVVTLPPDATGADVARVEQGFARLSTHGVTVRVHCERTPRGRAVA